MLDVKITELRYVISDNRRPLRISNTYKALQICRIKLQDYYSRGK